MNAPHTNKPDGAEARWVRSIMIMLVLVGVLVQGALALSTRSAEDHMSDCDVFRAKVLGECETEMQNLWDDQGGYIYTREQNIKDNRICTRIVDAVYEACKHPERKADARPD